MLRAGSIVDCFFWECILLRLRYKEVLHEVCSCKVLWIMFISWLNVFNLYWTAIGSFGGIFILSTLSTCSIEDVAKEAPNTIKWFQLYIYKNRLASKPNKTIIFFILASWIVIITIDYSRKLSESIVRRAEAAGFKALVLTVDANVFGIRYSDEKNGFTLPSHLK